MIKNYDIIFFVTITVYTITGGQNISLLIYYVEKPNVPIDFNLKLWQHKIYLFHKDYIDFIL